jgi:hypothetical protein
MEYQKSKLVLIWDNFVFIKTVNTQIQGQNYKFPNSFIIHFD